MGVVSETDELFKPFTVKNKEDHGLDFEIDLKTQVGFDNFARLFEYFNGISLGALCDDFIALHFDVIDYSTFELDNVGLEKKGGETFTFVPTSRLGRFIVCLAMDMLMHKEEK